MLFNGNECTAQQPASTSTAVLAAMDSQFSRPEYDIELGQWLGNQNRSYVATSFDQTMEKFAQYIGAGTRAHILIVIMLVLDIKICTHFTFTKKNIWLL